jgi:hypothetical protein
MMKNTWQKLAALAGISILMTACASGPKVSVTQTLDEHASDAPYKKILVVTLFDSFDARRYLEEEVVKALAEHGAVGVPSTSMMNTKTPVEASTFIKMVQDIDADAVLLTQLTSHHVDQTAKASSPRATYNYWPTHYYNVFEVELTEYVEPARLQLEHDLVLASQVFSAKSREPVWAIESRSDFVVKQEDGLDYNIFVNEAAAIVKHLTQDKLVAP